MSALDAFPADDDPALRSFLRVLSLLRHDWVRDFVFPHVPQPHLFHAALVASDPARCSRAASISIRTLSDPTSLPTPPNSLPHSLDETMRLFFIPSFTTGHITVGFQIYERIHTNTVGTSRYYFSRTIRDDIHNTLISISEHPSLALTELNFGTQFTAAARDQAFMLFQTAPFRAALHNLPHHLDIHAFRGALVYAFHTVEQKDCPVCHIPKPSACACPSPTRIKRHPADMLFENENMKTYCGAFDGHATVNVYWNGCVQFTQRVPSICHTVIGTDATLETKLSQWGLSHLSHAHPINIRHLQVPNIIKAAFFATGFVPAAAMRIHHLLEQPERRESFHSASDYSLNSVSPSELLPLESHLPLPLQELDWFLSTSQDLPPGPDDTPTPDPQVSPQFSGTDADETDIINIWVSPETSINNKDLISIAPPDPLASIPGVESSQNHNASTATVLQPPIAPGVRVLPLLAPAWTFCSTGEADEQDENQMKIQKKKIRNRVAAHRSNQKRKKAYGRIKAEIRAAVEQEAKLRERWVALRAENTMLRGAISLNG